MPSGQSFAQTPAQPFGGYSAAVQNAYNSANSKWLSNAANRVAANFTAQGQDPGTIAAVGAMTPAEQQNYLRQLNTPEGGFWGGFNNLLQKYMPLVIAGTAAGMTGGAAGAALGGGLSGGVAGGAVSGAVGSEANSLLQNGSVAPLGQLGKGALIGAVTGGLSGSGLAGSGKSLLTDVYGIPQPVAGGLVQGGIGAGMGALGGALNGTGAGTGALQGAAMGAAGGGISGLLGGGLNSAGVNPAIGNALTSLGTGALMNNLFSPHVSTQPVSRPAVPTGAMPTPTASQAPQMMQAGGGLLNVAKNYPNPMTNGLLSSLSNSPQPTAQAQSVGGQMPAGVTNYSQIAYQNAGSPHSGPYAQVAAPSGIGVPGEPPQGGGNSVLQTLLGGLLGTASSNPNLLKSLGSSLGGLLNGNTIGAPVFGGTSTMTDPFAGTNLAANATGSYNSQPIDLSSLYGSPFDTSTPAVPSYTNYANLSGMTMPSYNFGGP